MGKRGEWMKVLKPGTTPNGYYVISLFKNKKRHKKSIHRIVALTFLGDSKLHCNHINGMKTDNRLENLEYVTHKQNILHAYKIGLRSPGEGHPASKLTEKQAVEIKASKLRPVDLAKKYSVTKSTIHRIKSGRSWKHL